MRKINPYFKVLKLILLFVLLFFVSVLSYLKIINIFVTGVLGTLWYWNYITTGIISIIYVFKFRNFVLFDIIISLLLSLLCCTSGFNPIIVPVTFLSFLSGAFIFRSYNQEFKFCVGLKNTLKSIGFGILIGIVPGMINIIEFLLKGYTLKVPNFYDIYSSFLRALQPGISEEIVFRFFLFAYVTAAFKGKIPKTMTSNLLIYLLLIVPHCIMHNEFLPVNFISNFNTTILNLIYMCAVFGIPSVYLIKNRNLYCAIGFHWFCDFVRFTLTNR